MKFFALAALSMMQACTLSTCSKDAASRASEPMDFAEHFFIASNFDPDANVLKITVSLDRGFHAYAQGEKIGRPISLTINPKNGWMPDGEAVLPAGIEQSLGALGYSVVLEGEFSITQKLRAGAGAGEAYLNLQICTEALCDKPRSHVITWP